MTDSQINLWATARAFASAVVVCVVGVVMLFVLVARAHAGGSISPYPPAGYEPGPEPAWIACQPDVRLYCPNIVPGGGRILSCLAGNKDRLRNGCRDVLLRAWSYYRR